MQYSINGAIMIKKLSLLALLGLAALAANAEIINIDNAELARLASSGVPVVDIRTEGEWKATGVIAGSKLLTYFDENGKANPPQWLEKLKGVANSDQPVILVCRSGKRSRVASEFLSEQSGFKKVYNVTNGLNGWGADNRPMVPATTSMAVCPSGAKC
jgi:rhodanese-related sulfurtransferase